MSDHHLFDKASPCIDVHTWACFTDDCCGFKMVLNNNMYDINKTNCAGWTPLMYACATGNHGGVEVLLEMKANERVVNNAGQSAFMIAAMNGHEDILDLLDSNICMEMTSHHGWTPLIGALNMGNYSTVRYLVKKGANVNAIAKDNGASPLMLAAADGEGTIVQILLAYGADPTFVSMDLKTAENIANEHGHVDLANYLKNLTSCHSQTTGELPKDLQSLLKSINQDKYWPLFKKKLVSLEQFLEFSEEDLKDIGIRILGPRKKMALAIESFKFERGGSSHTLEDT